MTIIIDKTNLEDLNFFRDLIIKQISKKFKNFNNNLHDLHKFIKYDEINDIRIGLFKKINKTNYEKKIFNLIGKELIKIIGPDISIQTKLNLSILMPNDKTSMLPMHSDCWSSDSPFQINSWIPLTDTFDTNSMYLFNEKKSLKILSQFSKYKVVNKNISETKVEKKEYVNLKYGQILIFNPALLHGNSINKTNRTRISLNIRFKSLFSPEPQNNPDRQYGSYYKDFVTSKNTLLALKILKKGFIN